MESRVTVVEWPFASLTVVGMPQKREAHTVEVSPVRVERAPSGSGVVVMTPFRGQVLAGL